MQATRGFKGCIHDLIDTIITVHLLIFFAKAINIVVFFSEAYSIHVQGPGTVFFPDKNTEAFHEKKYKVFLQMGKHQMEYRW